MWIALDDIHADSGPLEYIPGTHHTPPRIPQVQHQDMSMRRSPGRSYRFYTGTPLWPFGFSLSYTRWSMEWACREWFLRIKASAASGQCASHVPGFSRRPLAAAPWYKFEFRRGLHTYRSKQRAKGSHPAPH